MYKRLHCQKSNIIIHDFHPTRVANIRKVVICKVQKLYLCLLIQDYFSDQQKKVKLNKKNKKPENTEGQKIIKICEYSCLSVVCFLKLNRIIIVVTIY